MKKYYKRFFSLIFGLFLFAFGIVLTMKANIGYAPWDVFQVGLSKTVGISLGSISILVGVFLVIITVLLGEKVGFGSILNMILIGVFLDIILKFNLIPENSNFLAGILILIVGLFIISLASYFYIGSGLGAGPRDSLMVAITKKSKLPIGMCRGMIEATVVFIGWLLGGMVGLGTVIAVFAIGFCVQITFKLLQFDVTKVEHETLDKTFKNIFHKNYPEKEIISK
ncbi:MAG: hypothetical protein PHD33_04570 [Atribacterota bacterium]|nr:hypothetical protein [Atribacterota bacterium]